MRRALKILSLTILTAAVGVIAWVATHVRQLSVSDLIHCAIDEDSVARLLCLAELQLFRDINAAERNNEGDTLLAQSLYNTPAIPTDDQHDQRAFTMARWLLSKGSKVDAANGQGMTLLMKAVVEANIPLIKFLVSRKANPNAPGKAEFEKLSATRLVERISATNKQVAQGLLRCDESALVVKYTEAEGAMLSKVLSYAHFRVQRLVANALGRSPRWDNCQPLPPEKVETILSKLAPTLELIEIRRALKAKLP